MRRELTEEELLFIENNIVNRSSVEERREERKEIRRAKKERVKPWQKAKNWVILIMSIPCIASIILFTIILRVQAVVGGGDNLRWLARQKVDKNTEVLLKQYKVDWLPTFIHFYNDRYILIGAMFTIAIILSMLILIIDAIRQTTKNRANNEDTTVEREI